MGDLIERMRNKGKVTEADQSTEYSTPELAEETAPVIQRIELMLEFFIGSIKTDTAKNKRMAYMLKRIAAEAAEEMTDVPPEIIELYFTQAAGIMYWAATGDRITDMPLPPGFTLPDPPQRELESDDAS